MVVGSSVDISGSKAVSLVVLLLVSGSFGTGIESCGQHILGKRKPPTFWSPHNKLCVIRLGSFGWIGLVKFTIIWLNGLHSK